MKVISLQSGSTGNCTYVEAGDVRLLIDAGISGRDARSRLAAQGRDITAVHALLISHDHRDHVQGVGVFQRTFRLPVHVTKRTLAAARSKCNLGPLSDVHHFRAGCVLRFGNVVVETISTPHDAADGVVFVIDDGRRRLGILTDLGHLFAGLESVVRSLDAVIIESNYDPDLLANGPYPQFLKERIRGPCGHLSNVESAKLLRRAATRRRLAWACLAHLSEQNNDPDLALDTHREVIGDQLPLFVASRYAATRMLEV